MDSIFSGSFDNFNLQPELLQGLKDMGYSSPTIVQQKVYDPVVAGRDLIVKSQTGSGKTAAFCLPLLGKLDKESKKAQILILLPTRELARQVTRECQRISHHQAISVVSIYGGASFDAQISALNASCHVVVGTPGRIKDMLNRGHLKLSDLRAVVLDEADEMLSMGFWDDVTYILEKTPSTRQTLLFSATMPGEIRRAAEQFMKDHEVIDISEQQVAVPTISHIVHHEDESMPRPRNLLYALELHNPTKCVIFCNRREETEVISQYLSGFGYKNAKLNGELAQGRREKIVADLHENRINMLIATDLAARGLDFEGISHVFNYDMPENEESYVHRIGRTGRIGKLGVAVNMLRNKDLSMLSALETKHEIKFIDMPMPKENEIMWLQAERLAQQLVELADGVEISQYGLTAAEMLKRGDSKEILGFLLRSYFRNVRPYGESLSPAPSQLRQPNAHPNRNVVQKKLAPSSPPKAPVEATENKVLVKIQDEQHNSAEPARKNILPPRPAPSQRNASQATTPNDAHTDIRETPISPTSFPPSFRFFISLGRKDGFNQLAELAQHLAKLGNIDLGAFTGDGRLQDKSSFLEIDKDISQSFIAAIELHNQSTGAGIRVERSAPPPRRRFNTRY